MLFKGFYTFVISFQIFSFQTILANEPVCSKFPYEESMLEKMIRTEIKVEAMVNEIKATQERVVDTLGIVDKKIDIFERLIQATQTNVSQETENQRRNFIELQGKLERPAVGFHVHHLTDVNLNTENEVLVFDSIITNEGSGYDTSTGIFTAPVGGLYHLAVHICTQSGKYSYIGIVHADKVISKTLNYGSASQSCSSVDAVIRVKSGERVWVISLFGGSSYQLYQDVNMINSFTGFLIHI